MKRKTLILLVLVYSVWLVSESSPVRAECTCWDTYSQCLSVAVGQYETCVWQAQNTKDLCIADANPPSVCNENYNNTVAQCLVTYYDSEFSCDQALNSCLMGCGGGGGGGGGGGYCHQDPAMGYWGYSLITGTLSTCITDGGSAFTDINLSRSAFDTCMTNTGGSSQEFCCREQIKVHLDENAGCNLDPRTSCQHCINF